MLTDERPTTKEFERNLLLAAYTKQRFIVESDRVGKFSRAAQRFRDFRLKMSLRKADQSKALGIPITHSVRHSLSTEEDCTTN